MKKAFTLFVFAGSFMILLQVNAFAQDEQEKRHRLEANFSYEHLTPRDVYGPWKTLSIGFYNKLKSDLTYFLQLGAFSRDEGDAGLGTLGAYKDWGSRFYTYSALSAGTNSEYLPRFRIDNDFNLKIGTKKNLVWTTGISYIRYFNVHKDLILSTGLTLYHQEWILSYRVFRNDSSPGNVISYSHLVSTGYGREGWQWTYLDFSYGKQAYLATNLSNPEQIAQNSSYVSLKHRRWLGIDYGIFMDISYLKLEDGYEKYGFSPGIFREF